MKELERESTKTAPVTAVMIVDHGSRREESNQMLLDAVRMFEWSSPYQIVEPAHMEQALPDIPMAFDRCVRRGAGRIIVFPYFLLPGRHWSKDIPARVAAAARRHAAVRFLVTAPIGLHPLMPDIISSRIEQCLEHAAGRRTDCEYCRGSDHCHIQDGTHAS